MPTIVTEQTKRRCAHEIEPGVKCNADISQYHKFTRFCRRCALIRRGVSRETAERAKSFEPEYGLVEVEPEPVVPVKKRREYCPHFDKVPPSQQVSYEEQPNPGLVILYFVCTACWWQAMED